MLTKCAGWYWLLNVISECEGSLCQVIPALSHFNLVNIQPISFNIHITMGGMPCLQVCTLWFYLFT